MQSRMGKYTDNEFPANNKSIEGFHSGKVGYKVHWKRPEEFLKGKIKIYDVIEPDDIYQGSLGDCYLLAAISSIAKNPKRLERIFLTK